MEAHWQAHLWGGVLVRGPPCSLSLPVVFSDTVAFVSAVERDLAQVLGLAPLSAYAPDAVFSHCFVLSFKVLKKINSHSLICKKNSVWEYLFQYVDLIFYICDYWCFV